MTRNTPESAIEPAGPRSRRDFLKASGMAAVSGALGPNVARSAHPGGLDTIRVGLVGCGGRGIGAAENALTADPGVVLTALGDVFEQPIAMCLNNMAKRPGLKEKVEVQPERCFVGLDAYQRVIDSGVDVVLLATPPGFRPQQLAAAVAAGKHVFCEKPMATDAPGVRSVLETVARSKEKRLALVAGFCWRYDYARREVFKRIHGGEIGPVRAMYSTFYANPVKPMKSPSERAPNCSDLEWQIRNWYNFTWLSGDGLVEQAVHSVDKIMWAMQEQPPLKAVAVGGRQLPNYEGNIFDHFEVNYEWADGMRAFLGCRQISGCWNQNADFVIGSKATARIGTKLPPSPQVEITGGDETWRYTGPKNNMYQTELDEMFASIRDGNPINDGVRMSYSTLAAIMGRMAAYTGQEVSWEMALNSKEQLVPDNLDWNMKLDFPKVAMPGLTKFV
jgi:predicted dehydrogenase